MSDFEEINGIFVERRSAERLENFKKKQPLASNRKGKFSNYYQFCSYKVE